MASASSAARSIDVYLANKTDKPLNLAGSGVSHGESKIPIPGQILAGHTGHFQIESNGFMTGAEGWSNWNIGDSDAAQVKLTYNNPFSGTNKYSGYTSGPEGDRYEVTQKGGSGDNAEVTFTARIA